MTESTLQSKNSQAFGGLLDTNNSVAPVVPVSLRGRFESLGSYGRVGFPGSKGTSAEGLEVVNNGHQARDAGKQTEEERTRTQQPAGSLFSL